MVWGTFGGTVHSTFDLHLERSSYKKNYTQRQTVSYTRTKHVL